MMMALLLVMTADAEPPAKPAKPREVAVTGLPGGEGGMDKPTRIKSEKELEAAIKDKSAREAILKATDFKKEHLLYFAWAGSGGDRVEPAEGKAGEAAFTLTRGLTKDLRMHAKLFAIRAKAEVKLSGR